MEVTEENLMHAIGEGHRPYMFNMSNGRLYEGYEADKQNPYDYPVAKIVGNHNEWFQGTYGINTGPGEDVNTDVTNVYTITIPQIDDELARFFYFCFESNQTKPMGIYAHGHPTHEQIDQINRYYEAHRIGTRLVDRGRYFQIATHSGEDTELPCFFLNICEKSINTSEEIMKYIICFYLLKIDPEAFLENYSIHNAIIRNLRQKYRPISITSKTKRVMWVTMENIALPRTTAFGGSGQAAAGEAGAGQGGAVFIFRVHEIYIPFDQVRSEDVESIFERVFGETDLVSILATARTGANSATLDLANYLNRPAAVPPGVPADTPFNCAIHPQTNKYLIHALWLADKLHDNQYSRISGYDEFSTAEINQVFSYLKIKIIFFLSSAMKELLISIGFTFEDGDITTMTIDELRLKLINLSKNEFIILISRATANKIITDSVPSLNPAAGVDPAAIAAAATAIATTIAFRAAAAAAAAAAADPAARDAAIAAAARDPAAFAAGAAAAGVNIDVIAAAATAAAAAAARLAPAGVDPAAIDAAAAAPNAIVTAIAAAAANTGNITNMPEGIKLILFQAIFTFRMIKYFTSLVVGITAYEPHILAFFIETGRFVYPDLYRPVGVAEITTRSRPEGSYAVNNAANNIPPLPDGSHLNLVNYGTLIDGGAKPDPPNCSFLEKKNIRFPHLDGTIDIDYPAAREIRIQFTKSDGTPHVDPYIFDAYHKAHNKTILREELQARKFDHLNPEMFGICKKGLCDWLQYSLLVGTNSMFPAVAGDTITVYQNDIMSAILMKFYQISYDFMENIKNALWCPTRKFLTGGLNSPFLYTSQCIIDTKLKGGSDKTDGELEIESDKDTDKLMEHFLTISEIIIPYYKAGRQIQLPISDLELFKFFLDYDSVFEQLCEIYQISSDNLFEINRNLSIAQLSELEDINIDQRRGTSTIQLNPIYKEIAKRAYSQPIRIDTVEANVIAYYNALLSAASRETPGYTKLYEEETKSIASYTQRTPFVEQIKAASLETEILGSLEKSPEVAVTAAAAEKGLPGGEEVEAFVRNSSEIASQIALHIAAKSVENSAIKITLGSPPRWKDEIVEKAEKEASDQIKIAKKRFHPDNRKLFEDIAGNITREIAKNIAARVADKVEEAAAQAAAWGAPAAPLTQLQPLSAFNYEPGFQPGTPGYGRHGPAAAEYVETPTPRRLRKSGLMKGLKPEDILPGRTRQETQKAMVPGMVPGMGRTGSWGGKYPKNITKKIKRITKNKKINKINKKRITKNKKTNKKTNKKQKMNRTKKNKKIVKRITNKKLN